MKAFYTYTLKPQELAVFKQKVLYWLRPYSTFAYLDNNQYQYGPNRYELLVAAGVQTTLELPKLSACQGKWVFGHMAYDLKNSLYPKLNTQHALPNDFEQAFFFCPQIVLSLPAGSNQISVYTYNGADAAEILAQILDSYSIESMEPPIKLKPQSWKWGIDKETYLEKVLSLQQHIKEGNCYEINLCNKLSAQAEAIQPIELFQQLNSANPAPFAALYKRDAHYVLCTSPERYLYKKERTILSQPIKGTTKRLPDPLLDAKAIQMLQEDIKERAENLMITDLVRNDLAQLCEVGSIQVPDLLGRYTFSSLHHLISTIQGNLRSEVSLKEMLTVPFPMGSMTGAPKHIVMELIDEYETSARGLYAGTIGYINPDGDFDFNVVIRSLIINEQTGDVHFHTGGAITIDSQPEKEWEEIQLKAQRLIAVLQNH